MKYAGLPSAMWILFAKSFRQHLVTVFRLDAQTAKAVTRKAKVKYKEILTPLPDFEKGDSFSLNLIGCAMLCAFILSMPARPDEETLTDYYARAMMTRTMKLFCRIKGKRRFAPKTLQAMQKLADLHPARRNPYSWDMEIRPYADGSGFEARFHRCGICTLMRELGLSDLTPAMCHLDYTMSEAGGTSRFVREYTLASGGPYCDNGYHKK